MIESSFKDALREAFAATNNNGTYFGLKKAAYALCSNLTDVVQSLPQSDGTKLTVGVKEVKGGGESNFIRWTEVVVSKEQGGISIPLLRNNILKSSETLTMRFAECKTDGMVFFCFEGSETQKRRFQRMSINFVREKAVFDFAAKWIMDNITPQQALLLMDRIETVRAAVGLDLQP